jgi:hypothetical protein
VRAAFQLPWLHGQKRLSSIQRLNLALLIDTQHQCVIGRVNIQTRNVPHFFDQQRVRRQFEGVSTMRLQSESAPDSADSHPAQPGRLRQAARTPVRLPSRRALQSLNHDPLHLLIADLARCTRSWLVIQSFQTLLQKPAAPFAHHTQRAAKFLCHRLVVQTIAAGQHHSCPSRQQHLTPRTVG